MPNSRNMIHTKQNVKCFFEFFVRGGKSEIRFLKMKIERLRLRKSLMEGGGLRQMGKLVKVFGKKKTVQGQIKDGREKEDKGKSKTEGKKKTRVNHRKGKKKTRPKLCAKVVEYNKWGNLVKLVIHVTWGH